MQHKDRDRTESAEFLFAEQVGRDRFVGFWDGVLVQHVFGQHIAQPV